MGFGVSGLMSQLGFRFQVSAFRFLCSDLRFRSVLGLRSKVSCLNQVLGLGLRSRVLGLTQALIPGFTVSGLRSQVSGSGLGFWVSGFGSGFEVSGSDLKFGY